MDLFYTALSDFFVVRYENSPIYIYQIISYFRLLNYPPKYNFNIWQKITQFFPQKSKKIAYLLSKNNSNWLEIFTKEFKNKLNCNIEPYQESKKKTYKVIILFGFDDFDQDFGQFSEHTKFILLSAYGFNYRFITNYPLVVVQKGSTWAFQMNLILKEYKLIKN